MLEINVNEILDQTSKKNQIKKKEISILILLLNRYTPIPDSIIAAAVPNEIEMVKIGQARSTLMNMRLTQVRTNTTNIL
jgi:hypothetical protein